jgi:hypothetical protein
VEEYINSQVPKDIDSTFVGDIFIASIFVIKLAKELFSFDLYLKIKLIDR